VKISGAALPFMVHFQTTVTLSCRIWVIVFCCRDRVPDPQFLSRNLLREIRDAAVEGSSNLETLLCECRVLATRLKPDELKK
jgi:hypothetical protein